MQRSEFPPHRSLCEGYLTVKNVPGAPISSSKGPQGALSLSLFASPSRIGRVPSVLPGCIPSALARKIQPYSCRYTRAITGHFGVLVPRNIIGASKCGDALKTQPADS